MCNTKLVISPQQYCCIPILDIETTNNNKVTWYMYMFLTIIFVYILQYIPHGIHSSNFNNSIGYYSDPLIWWTIRYDNKFFSIMTIILVFIFLMLPNSKGPFKVEMCSIIFRTIIFQIWDLQSLLVPPQLKMSIPPNQLVSIL